MNLSEKKLNIKSIILITVILPVFVIVASSIAIYITAKSVQPQETADISVLSKEEAVIKSIPRNEEDALTLLTKLFSSAVKGGIVKYNKHTDAGFESIECDNESVQDFLTFAGGDISSKLMSFYDDVSIKYGEDASAILSVLPGTAPSEMTAEISEDDILTMALTYNTVFNNMYFLSDDTAALKMFTTENAGVFSVINEKFIPEVFVFTLTADTKTGNMLSFTIDRAYKYSANISFKNSLSPIGSTPLEMKLHFSEIYNFSYAGIEIAEDIMTLNVGDYDTLTVTPFVEENLSADEYTLKFSSYDKYLTIDENGQITAIKYSDKPIAVRVTLEYLGKTFTDSCTVYVVKPVENIRISDTSLTLKSNETYELSAEIRPDDATIKNIIWMSSDEEIITVNEAGLIQAKKNGTATISAISEQGLIVAKCTVTVTD